MRYFILFIGCFINFSLFGQSKSVNYFEHIKPIMEAHCITCHDGTSVGPMPLNDYESVRAYAAMIEYVTKANLMPPFLAEQSYPKLKYQNSLTDSELTNIKKWIEDGLERGQEKEPSLDNSIVSPCMFDSTLMYVMEEAFLIEDDYKMKSQVFVIPTHLEEDVFINKLEFLPGNKQQIRSCAISIDTSGYAQKLDQQDLEYGYTSLGGVGFIPEDYLWYYWIPDMKVSIFDSTDVKKIPANSHFLLHITYGPSREKLVDSSYLKLNVVPYDSTCSEIKSEVLVGPDDFQNSVEINPNLQQRNRAEITIENDIYIHGLTPLGQYVCKAWNIYAITPKNVKIDLLQIMNWDMAWKRKFEFQQKIFIPAQSKIVVIAEYDNTEENALIPVLPPKKIIVGEGKNREMFMVQYDYSLKK